MELKDFDWKEGDRVKVIDRDQEELTGEIIAVRYGNRANKEYLYYIVKLSDKESISVRKNRLQPI